MRIESFPAVPMAPETDKSQQKRNDPRSTEDLIHLALTEEHEDAAWDLVVVLHFRGTAEVLAHAQKLCESAEAKERQLGANILSQLGIPERTFPEECFKTLARMLTTETDPGVLSDIGVAFGHLHDPRAIKLLVPLQHHPDADVRFGVVYGISPHPYETAIKTLIELSADEEEEVRDWATFAIGSEVNVDTPEIREALLARLTDPCDDARCEALVGLARRKDKRELTSGTVGLLAIEPAEELADPRLGPALIQLREAWADHDSHVGRLHKALLACLPAGSS
jgi:HEAT repeat protein